MRTPSPRSEHSRTPQGRLGGSAPHLRLRVHIAALSATNLILWFYLQKFEFGGDWSFSKLNVW